MNTRTDNPKVFISYSWTSPQHEDFVLSLATRLMGDGVDVILDKFYLKEGHDKYKFMEQCVTDPTIEKVLIISDKKYAEKADTRKGGVGDETQIISPEIYAKTTQEKFIPIVVEYEEGNPCLPVYLKSRLYIDLTENHSSENYEKLLRNIYNRPKIEKPILGKIPSFLLEDKPLSVETTSIFLNLKEAIQNEKKSWRKLSKEFLEQFISSMESLRITTYSNIEDLEEKTLNSLDLYRPYRDQLLEHIQLLCDFQLIDDFKEDLHFFLEKLLCLKEPPRNIGSYNPRQFENFQIISFEVFLYLVSMLIKTQYIAHANYFLTEKYYISTSSNKQMYSWSEFYCYSEILENRNNRLELRRKSLLADMIHDNINNRYLPFEYIIQSDFILYMCSIITNKSDYWYPQTMIYHNSYTPFEIFLRAETKTGFDKLKLLFDIETKEHLIDLITKYQSEFERFNISFRRLNIKNITNLENLYMC